MKNVKFNVPEGIEKTEEIEYVLKELMNTIEKLSKFTDNITPLYMAGAHWGAIYAVDILNKKKETKKWISVSDHLPPKRIMVLMAVKGKTKLGNLNCFVERDTPIWVDYQGTHVNPTHWMRLPKAPEEK